MDFGQITGVELAEFQILDHKLVIFCFEKVLTIGFAQLRGRDFGLFELFHQLLILLQHFLHLFLQSDLGFLGFYIFVVNIANFLI